MTLLAGGMMLLQFGLWMHDSPFSVFTESAFQKVGLSNKYLNVEVLDHHYQQASPRELGKQRSNVFFFSVFRSCFSSSFLALVPLVLRILPIQWSTAGLAVTFLNGVVLTVLAVLLWARRHNHSGVLHTVCLMIMQLAAAFHFSIIILAPFTFVCRKGFVLLNGTNSSNDSFIGSDPAMREELQTVIGAGFTAVAFSFYSNLFLFQLHAVPTACFVASILFWYQHYTSNVKHQSLLWRLQAG